MSTRTVVNVDWDLYVPIKWDSDARVLWHDENEVPTHTTVHSGSASVTSAVEEIHLSLSLICFMY